MDPKIFEAAFKDLVAWLAEIEGLPSPGLNPVHPDTVDQFPALFMAPDVESPLWGESAVATLHGLRSNAAVLVLVYISGAEDHPALEIIRKVQAIKDAVRELARSTVDEGMGRSYKVSRVSYDHERGGRWHAAVLNVDIISYDF